VLWAALGGNSRARDTFSSPPLYVCCGTELRRHGSLKSRMPISSLAPTEDHPLRFHGWGARILLATVHREPAP
jgi:hypothetical protein